MFERQPWARAPLLDPHRPRRVDPHRVQGCSQPRIARRISGRRGSHVKLGNDLSHFTEDKLLIRNFCMFGRAVALGAIVLCGLALASAALPAEAALDHGLQTRTALPSASPLFGHSVSDWRLIHPTAITSGGGYIWVTSGNWVIQLSASTGALVRVIQGPSYRFNAPWGITSGGG